MRKFEKKFNRNGWPFNMIVDGKGNVVYGECKLIENEMETIREILDQVAPEKIDGFNSFNNVEYANKTYKTQKMARQKMESFPCLVKDSRGELYMSYVTLREKENQTILRFLKDGAGEEEILVSDGLKDAYFATSIVDSKDRVWIFFTALSDKGFYDVFARYWTKEAGLSEAINLTLSDDDAMHPDATVDLSGRIWVTYFRWCKMGFYSRDKEVYARCYDNGWEEGEYRLSPEDLPNYEDHTDPSIAPDPKGGVCVTWSWDMHTLRDKKYSRYQETYDAEAPTIFGQRFGANDQESELLFMGHAGIDAAPELHLASDSKLWCAWNSLRYSRSGYSKTLYASYCSKENRDREKQYVLEKNIRDVCTPRFVEVNNKVYVIWSSQDQRKTWHLKYSVFEEDGFSKPAVIDAKNHPRLSSVLLDQNNKVWLAYVEKNGSGRKIAIKNHEL